MSNRYVARMFNNEMITKACIGLTTSSGLTHKHPSKMSLTLKTNINLGDQKEKGNHQTDPRLKLIKSNL